MELPFISIIDILGTFSFAVAGAFAAMEKKLDLFGVLIISFATAIGGGTIRDLLIGRLPVAWLTNSTAIWVILIGASSSPVFFFVAEKICANVILLRCNGTWAIYYGGDTSRY
ncbi:trimeric intracellular cation channel family protein [Segetibacter aerophilus]|uniref:Glycine transporter domain-containing protein n=1 Tax=Segetibacter aerophilus TaxID=670293 RepID=A0A512BJX0_9BACT|nr:TRIC cation channel family protein [Segetibacter aerophilus]GEO12256.1 hypothetical protein SAE01_47520 [Segetibacter aerophilus]